MKGADTDTRPVDARAPNGSARIRRPSIARRRSGGRSPGGGVRRVPLILVLPGLVAYAIVVIYPNAAGALYAFTDWDGLSRNLSFVGLANFRLLFTEGQALTAITNTVLFAIAMMVVTNVLGLLLALALDTNIRSRNLLRTVFFAPAMIAPVILAFLWQYLYAPAGPFNRVLAPISAEVNWLGDPNLALWSIIIAVIWQYSGISMVIFLAGLQSVPKDLHEAAGLDGAGAVQRFWHVTRPMIAPATTIAVVFMLIVGLKIFDQVFAMTGGGPGYATETLSTIIYDEAFVLGNFAYATAISLVLSVVVALAAFLQLKVLSRFEVER